MTASARDDVLGEDRFVLKGRIGGGAMGEVYRAHDRKRGIDVALKMLRDPEAQKIYRFKREFRALADVIHPNLVRLHELVSAGDRWFFTMELVDGIDFLTWVRRDSEAAAPREEETPTGDVDPEAVPSSDRDWPTVTSEVNSTFRARKRRLSSLPPGAILRPATPLLDDAQWARLRDGLRQLATGIQALHDHGTLHRDIKPSNTMVTRDGRVVLLDFGIISELSRPAADESAHVFGTPAYMAPEVGARRTLSEAADWYAVGVMLYEAMAGRRPFHAPATELLELKRLREPAPVRDFAIAPPDDLADLCTQLLSRDPERRPTGDEILARLGATRSTVSAAEVGRVAGGPLVGREQHLAALRTAYSAVLSGEPRVVLVSGVSGVGKSTLVSRFLAEVGADGQAMVIAGRCYERESVPFKAVDDLVDNLCQRLAALPKQEVVGILPRRVSALARLFPVLEQIEAVKNAPRRAGEPSDPHEQRRLAFEALRELLVRLSARRPLVMHIDDGQWGDDDSAALLAEVFRVPYAPPALLIVNYRETPDMGRFVEHVREVDSEHLALPVGDLSPEDARDLADRLLVATGGPVRFAETIARESGGNALFVTELVRYVSGGAEASSVSLEDIVRVRVAALRPGARRLLEMLAVAAWPVPRAIAITAAAVDDEAATVDALLDARLISVRTGSGGDVLETFHDRIRAAVVAQIPVSELPALHRQLALAIDVDDARLAEHLAEHLELAGDRQRAGACYRRAADAAAGKLAFARAGRMYARAIELLEPTGLERSHIHARMAEAFQNAGQGALAASAYLVAAGGVGRVEALRYRGQAGQQLLRAGHVDEGVAAIEAVLAEVGIRMPRSRWRVLLTLLGHRIRIRLGGLRFTQRSADQVTPEQLTKMDVCWTASVAIGMSDTMAGAVFQARHLIEALRTGEVNHLSHALAIEGVYRALTGTPAQASVDAIQLHARDMADRTGDPLSIAWAAGAYSCTRYQFGHWRRSCEAAQQSLVAMEGRAGMWFERATVEMYRLWSLYWMGHFRELVERTASLRAQAIELGDLYSATSLSIGLPALQWLVRGRPDEARQAADEALRGWSRRTYHLQHHWQVYALAHVDLYEGKARDAWRRLQRGWADAGKALLRNLQMIRLEILWARGRAAVMCAEQDEHDRPAMLRDAARCARALHRERRPDAEALALCLEAGVRAVRGDLAGALPFLSAATDRAGEQELGFIAAATRAARGRILGGERGAALTREAEAWMSDQAIADPQALCRVFLPGLPTATAEAITLNTGPAEVVSRPRS